MNYSPSKLNVGKAVVLGGFSLLFFIFFIFFIFSKINSLDKIAKENAEFSIAIEDSFRIKKDKLEIENDIAVVESFFIKQGEEPLFVEELEKLAKKNGLKVSTQSIIESKDLAEMFLPVYISLRYEGGFNNFVSFLTDLENMPKALIVSAVEQSLSSENSSWSGTIVVDVLKLVN